MNEIIGIMCAVAGIGAVVYAISLKVPFTWENRLAWGVPIALTFFGLTLLMVNRMNTPSYWDGPDILRLTSRPIPA
jgi:cytochrome c-type biogenesis protein CcmH/NrfF